MNEEDRRRLYEQLGLSRMPIATTGYTAPTQPTIGLTQATDYGTGTQTWEEILNPLGVQTQEQNRLKALGFGDPAVTITDDPYTRPVSNVVMAQPQGDKSVWTQLPEVLNQGWKGIPFDQNTQTWDRMPSLLDEVPVSTGGASYIPVTFNTDAVSNLDAGTYDALEHLDAVFGGVSQESRKDTAGRTAWKEVVGALPTTGLLGDISNWAVSTVMQKGLPFSGFTGDDIETAKTAESIKDAINNMVILDAKKSGVPKDDLIASVVTGVNPLIQTSAKQLSSAEDYVAKGGTLDRNDAIEMAFQQDTFATPPSVLAEQQALAKQQEMAKQVYAQLMSGRDRGEPSQAEINRAMERATQVDSFARGGDRGLGANFGGEMGAWT